MIRWFLSAMIASAVALAGPAWGRLAGRVVGPDGRPLVGAVVGLGLSTSRGAELSPVPQTLTDQRGAFSIAGPAGKVGLTITAKGCLPYFKSIDLHPGDSVPGLELRLEKGGIPLRGRLVAAPGRNLRGVRLGFGMLSNRVGDQFFARVVKGRFEVSLAPGSYLIRAEGEGQSAEVRLDLQEAKPDLTLQLVPEPSQASPAVRAWIKARAIPLGTTEPEGALGDLRPLKRVVGSAKVVGLGEGTHGTREFFQLKHRLFRFLVEELGFTALAFEADHADCQAVDDYLQTGEGEADQVVARMGRWIWDTEEVVALVRWMRAYNADPAHARKLHFYGIDMQSDREALAQARVWLAREAPEEAAVLADLERRAAGLPWFHTGALTQDQAAAWRKLSGEVTGLIGRIEARKERLTRTTSPKSFARQLQNLRTYAQWTAMMGVQAPRSPFSVRDEAMAANLQWVLDQESGGRVAVWAHNGHVAFPAEGPFPSMGNLLKARFGKDYLSLVLLFHRGALRAHPGRRRWEVPLPASATLNEALASTGYPVLALDLRHLPSRGPVRAWFLEPQGFWAIGSSFNPRNAEAFLEKAALPTCSDALLFVESTEASTPTHGGFLLKPRPGIPPGPVAPAPANLGFEAGAEAAGWTLNPGADFSLDVVEGGAREGTRSLRGLPRAEASSEAWWSLRQRVEAIPYRGKRVRISAWIRVEGGQGLQAELRGAYDTIQRPTQDLTRGYLRDPQGWTEIHCEGPVGENATILELELTLLGGVSSRVDGFRIEVVP